MSANVGLLSQVVKDKKKKKKKLTAKERSLEKLEKSSEKFLEDSELFNNLLISVSYWLKSKEKIAYKLFHQQCLQTLDHELFIKSKKKDDETNEAEKEIDNKIEINTLSTVDFKISYDDFKIVTSDLDIPCTSVQLHVLCKLLDSESTGSIDYRKFTPDLLNSLIRRRHLDGMRFIRKTEPTKYLSSITFKKDLAENFACHTPTYIKLDLRHVTFANDKEFRGHIKDEIVNTNTQIITLIELLKERLDVVSNKISIFQDISKTKSSYLEENRTLYSYGYTGADYNATNQGNDKIVLFFDYLILGNDDPILNCDFYFHEYKLNNNIKK